MRNIRVHPLLIGLLAIFLLTGKMLAACYTFFAIFIHEVAHYKVAAKRGYKLSQLTLMPFGAMLYTEENIHNQDAFYIASAGIVANLCICILIVASWWVMPSTYPYTHPLFNANFAIAIFNLLPAYPLDGARIILALSKKPHKTLARLQKVGVVLSFILFSLFIASMFYQLNLTLGIAAISLFIGARFGIREQTYLFLTEQYPFEKDKRHPVEQKVIYVDKEMEIKKIYPYFNKNKLLTIKITEGGKVVSEMAEEAFVLKLSGHASNDKIGNLLY